MKRRLSVLLSAGAIALAVLLRSHPTVAAPTSTTPARPPATATATQCLSECTPRIGIVSAFGAEADLLLARVKHPRRWLIHGQRYTTGELEGHRVVIVLTGVSMVNASLVTQRLIDHFRIDRLIMTGIAGGVNPSHRVGDVIVPDRWSMPLEVYWNADNRLPSPCGDVPGDLGCLGLRLAQNSDGTALPPLSLQGAGGTVPTGLFLRQTYALNGRNAPQGEYRLDYPVDAAMWATAQAMRPELSRCGPKAALVQGGFDEALCVRDRPRLWTGGRGASAGVFLAHPQVRQYLFDTLQVQAFDMETAAVAHVAYVNAVPYIAFRSLSDLAGAQEFSADVGALFASGLAEANEAAVTLAFLRGWKSPATGLHKQGRQGLAPSGLSLH